MGTLDSNKQAGGLSRLYSLILNVSIGSGKRSETINTTQYKVLEVEWNGNHKGTHKSAKVSKFLKLVNVLRCLDTKQIIS